MDKMTEHKNFNLEVMTEALEAKALLDISINVFKSENFIEFDRFQIAILLSVSKEKLQKLINKLDNEDIKI